jgi:uncharacterized membrane protein
MNTIVVVWIAVGWLLIGLGIGVLFGCFASQRSVFDIFKKEKKNGRNMPK